MNNHACQDCGWCHDFGTYGYCDNPEVKEQYSDSKLTYDELVQDNKCTHFDDDTWFGG